MSPQGALGRILVQRRFASPPIGRLLVDKLVEFATRTVWLSVWDVHCHNTTKDFIWYHFDPLIGPSKPPNQGIEFGPQLDFEITVA